MTPEDLINRILNAECGTNEDFMPHFKLHVKQRLIFAAQGIIDELSSKPLQLPNSNGDLEEGY